MGCKGLLRTSDIRRCNAPSDSGNHCSCIFSGNTAPGALYSPPVSVGTTCGMRTVMAFFLLADSMVSFFSTDDRTDSNADPSFCGNGDHDNYLVAVTDLYVFSGSNRGAYDVSAVKSNAQWTPGTDRGNDICAATY